MGKQGGFLTPKAISNRIKAKGLQRLRWYCQMCEKQCRDENGFQCHIKSESHLRQMKVFAENPTRIMEDYSKEFEDGFVDILSRRFGTRRVKANQVYQEYIQFKQHVHMNSTKWSSLSNFVAYLGKSSKVVVEETEKGLFIQWINRDPALLAKHAAYEKKQKIEEEVDELQSRLIRDQKKALLALGSKSLPPEASAVDLSGRSDSIKVAVAMPPLSSRPTASKKRHRGAALAFSGGDAANSDQVASSSSSLQDDSVLGKLMREEESRKRKAAAMSSPPSGAAGDAVTASMPSSSPGEERHENWLQDGIVVKVLNKKVGGGKYYKKKAQVMRVIDKFVGEIEILDEKGDILRVDQSHLETVVPAVGRTVLILNGSGRGSRGELLGINEEEFCASIKLLGGQGEGTVLDKVDYEDFSKLGP